jgi:2Fe-2S ferredoxin
MVKLVFVSSSGDRQSIDAEPGLSVMKAAKAQDVAGIVAECGGACMCATCHVRLDDEWLLKSGPRTAAEIEMLPFALDPGPNSRLSCQMTVRPELDGIVIYLPERQI